MIEELFNLNCIKTGLFTLKSGEVSKYYFDMKNVISSPKLLAEIGDKMHSLLKDCDLLCGVPNGGLPICSYISTKYNIPMIMPRTSEKKYGTKKQIEGTYSKNQRCVIIEDVITTGGSVNEVIELLKDKVNVVQVVTMLDRQQNHKCVVDVSSAICKNDITNYLLRKTMREKETKLCFSADLTDPELLLDNLKKVGDYISICKIHLDIIDFNKMSENLFIKSLITLSNRHNFLIMEDRKFVDISYIVEKQYNKFKNWVDLVTVHGYIHPDVIKKLTGVLILANMSNNNFDNTTNVLKTALKNKNHVIGFITQKRISNNETFLCMTPGINFKTEHVDDQKYNTPGNVDTDVYIVGRGIYNSENIVEAAKLYK